MDFYKSKAIINQEVDNKIMAFFNDKKTLELDFKDIIFKAEGNFGLGSKVIIDRIKSWISRYPDNIELQETILKKVQNGNDNN